jgi:hypothetical protein
MFIFFQGVVLDFDKSFVLLSKATLPMLGPTPHNLRMPQVGLDVVCRLQVEMFCGGKFEGATNWKSLNLGENNARSINWLQIDYGL